MSTFVQSLQSSATPVTQEASQAPLDAGRAERVYAAWKNIFEDARASDTARSLPDRGGRQHWHLLKQDESVPEHAANQRRDGSLAADLVCTDTSVPASTKQHTTIPRGTGYEPTERPVANVIEATFTDVTGACVVGLVAADAADSAGDVSMQDHYIHPSRPVGDQPPAPEVVSIILQGTDVSIVVRNAQLSAAKALQSALETARELTGRAAALRHLTLNGRVLYLQPDPSVSAGHTLFDC